MGLQLERHQLTPHLLGFPSEYKALDKLLSIIRTFINLLLE
jgi:hypothetical protein